MSEVTKTPREVVEAAGYTISPSGKAYRLVQPAMLSDKAEKVRLYPGLDECRAFLAQHGIRLGDVR